MIWALVLTAIWFLLIGFAFGAWRGYSIGYDEGWDDAGDWGRDAEPLRWSRTAPKPPPQRVYWDHVSRSFQPSSEIKP